MSDQPLKDIRKRFGGAVRIRRVELNLSQEELAERADLHRTYISDLERGKRNVSLENIEKLAKALNLSMADLMKRVNGS
jgi:transcriptional regulator with XRE-family HTH domain